MNKEADNLFDENEKLKAEIKNLNIEITKITKIIEERDKTIKDYEIDLKNREEEYKKMTIEITRITRTIEERNTVVKDYEKEKKNNDRLLADKDKAIKDYEKRIKINESRINRRK